MAFYIDKFGNKVEIGAGGGTVDVYFVDSEGALPVATQGSQAFITDTGTQSGNISSSYIKTATTWVKTAGALPISQTIIDNTIKRVADLPSLGRYIVPDSEAGDETYLDSEFTGKSGQYVVWDGLTTFTYSTPDSDDQVVIANGPNAGEVWEYKAGLWSATTISRVIALSNWLITSSYSVGDIVIYNNRFYQANSNISNGVAFTVGTASNTWKQVGDGSVIAEYGKVTCPLSQGTAIAASSGSPTTVLTFNIPSAGTWQINATVAFQQNPGGQALFALYSGGSQVSGTVTSGGFISSGAALQAGGTANWQVTTTGPATYTVGAYSPIGTVVLNNGTSGTTYGSYEKISGFAPITGQTTNVLKITNTTAQSGGSGSADVSYATGARMAFVPGDAVINSAGFTVGTNIITINTAGTYRFTADYSATDNGVSTTSIALQMGVNGTAYGNYRSSTAIVSSSMQVTLTELANLNAGDIVDFRMFNGSTNEVVAFTPRITILAEQVGTTATAGFTGVLSNDWNIANSYASGTIVTKDNLMYQANASIPSGTAFIEGTTGATWRLMNYAVASEYVEGAIAVTTNLALAVGSWTTFASLTIPSAGKWNVTGQMPIRYASAVVAFRLLKNGSSIWTSDDGTNGSDSTTANAHYLSTHIWNDYSFNAGDVLTYQVVERNDPALLYGSAAKGQFNARKVAGFVGLTKKVFTEPLTIGAITTAPTKATTKEVDYITLIDDNTGWCDVSFEYTAASATGSAAGSGGYLYSLPAGYAFNTTHHILDTVTTSISSARLHRIIPGSSGFAGISTSSSTAVIVPYDATRFKIVTVFQSGGTGHQSWTNLNASYYDMANTLHTVLGSFRFKKA